MYATINLCNLKPSSRHLPVGPAPRPLLAIVDGARAGVVCSPRPCGRHALGLRTLHMSSRYWRELSYQRGYPADSPRVVTGRIDLQHASSGLTVRALTTHQRRGVSEQLSDLFQFAAEAAPAPIAATVHGDLRRLQRGIAGRCIRGDGIPDPCARHRRRGANCIASCA